MSALIESFDRAAQRSGAFGRTRYIKAVSYRESTGTHRAIYDQILSEYGLGGPFLVTSVSTPLLAATWGLVRAGILSSPLDRGSAEIIAAAVAQAERCPFCVDVHSDLASADGMQATASRIGRRDWDSMAGHTDGPDQLGLWARDFVHGATTPPPVPDAWAPYAVSVALTFVHVTTMVTIFQSDGLVAGAGGSKAVDRMARLYLRRQLGKRMLGRTAADQPPAGSDAQITPSPHFDFALADPILARAWAIFDQAVAQAGGEELSGPTQAVVEDAIGHHHNVPSLDVRFIDDALTGVAPAEQGAARLAVLAGTAPYRVTETDIESAGRGGTRGERWVALAALGARARIRALADRI